MAALAKEVREAITKAIAEDDLEALLRVYDRKMYIVNSAACSLRGCHKDVFTGWVMRAMKDPNKPGLRDAIRAVVPTINAA